MRAGEATARPSPLHVTNGDSAANTLRQSSLGGAVLPWQDVLHEGPVPAGPRRELLQARAAFVSACGWGSRRSILASLERRDRQLVQALRDGQQVVLWFEHDLYDQLQLVDVLALAAPDAPELIWSDRFPAAAFRGLGELTADDLETLWPAGARARTRWLRRSRSGPPCATPTPSALAEADRVALLGLDRWLGGTHLTAAAAWRWDPAAGLLVRPLRAVPGRFATGRIPADVSGAG